MALALAAALTAGCGGPVQRGAPVSLHVSAAVSLTDALQKVAARWEQAGHGAVALNLAASNVLARQVLEGAPADVFLSADEAQMDRLVQSGDVDTGDRVDLLSNQLVVITPTGRTLRETLPAALAAVEAANADAGIVYRTDVVRHDAVTVAYAVPLADGPRIVYPAAIVKRTSNRAAAQAFLAFLQGSQARAIFADEGFVPIGTAAAR